MKSRVSEIDRLRLAAISLSVLLVLLLWILLPRGAHAATAREIDVSVDVALERFTKEIKGSKGLLAIAKGVLVFPSVYKAGFVVGGEYGEGALRIGGKTVESSSSRRRRSPTSERARGGKRGWTARSP
jgi:hypothetical protein